MKRLFFAALTLIAFCFAAWSQESETDIAETGLKPNRMLVVNELGQFVPFNLDHVADIRFAHIETPAACNVEIVESTHEETCVSVELTDEVSSYSIGFAPAKDVENLKTELDIIAWLEHNGAPVYDRPFDSLKVADAEHQQSGKPYTVLFAARDRYGTWDRASQISLTVPYPEVVGNPEIELMPDRISNRMLIVRMTPNSDVSKFYYMLNIEGETMHKYQELAESGTYNSFEEMIMDTGVGADREVRETFGSLSSNLNYELIIVLLDRQQTVLPAQIYPMP